MITIINKVADTLQPTDHPYLSGAWRPIHEEHDAPHEALQVIGDIPRDLDGLYVRNGHNQVHEPLGQYHPYDGDGMLHSMRIQNGRAHYRNRFIRTTGFLAEQAAGKSLWPGIIEPRRATRRGWGAIGAMKDNAGTDVKLHQGKIIATMSQCGEPYRLDPETLETLGPDANWAAKLNPYGICSHFKVDEHSGEMLFFNFGETEPYMHYGVIGADGKLKHYVPIDLPGARWPHDLGMTEHYAILHDLPMFFDPEMLAKGGHRLRFYRDIPARFGIIPRLGRSEDVKWFEATPCYLLHLANCFEDGDDVVMDGCIQYNPVPDLSALPREGYDRMHAMLDMYRQQVRMHRWRFNMVTGETREYDLDDEVSEFPMVNGRHNGRKYRYSYNATMVPGIWLLDGLKRYDLDSGDIQGFQLPKGQYLSEAPFAPRVGATEEGDGYLVSFITNLTTDRGECAIFDARDITRGPLARIILPSHIPLGAHAFWADAEALHPA